MTDLKGEKIFDSVFDASRHFVPSTILLEFDADKFRPFKSANVYRLIGLPV